MAEVSNEKWTICFLEECADILDNLRKPINSDERAKRTGNVPYYGATGQVGWIDECIFNEELVLLGEDAAPFFDKQKNVAFKVEGKSWVNNHAHVLRAKDGITINSFLLYYLNHFDYTGYVGGTTRLKLTQGSLKKIPVPVPSLVQQKRIVAKLDEAFKHLETLKAKLERIPELLKKFRQITLSHAVTGKLTEEWRKGKALGFQAKRLLSSIKSDKQEWFEKQSLLSKKNNGKKPRQPKLEVDYSKTALNSVSLPETWEIAFLEELSAPKENALKAGPFGSSLKKEFYVEKGYKIYGQEQVIKGDINYGDYYITEEKYKSLENCKIEAGDVLISLVGTIGKVLIVPNAFEPGIINPRLLKFSLHPSVNRAYIKNFLDSSVAKEILNKDSHGGTMEILNLDMLKKLPIPVPPESEQKEIACRVGNLFAKANLIESQYNFLKEKIDKLPQALLAKAFRGELVAQDESDEPANVLLERVEETKV